jgi:hypothetical protein
VENLHVGNRIQMNKRYNGFPPVELQIPVRTADLPEFLQLLQRGVIIEAEIGCSIRSFLYDRLRLSPDFVDDYIQTIFLDGRPVDDLDGTYVKDGCTLGLSSAMPGLVGATMRRGGYYASLRSQISCKPEAAGGSEPVRGSITLKLFNFVAARIGKALLQDGVFLKKGDVEDLLGRKSAPEIKGIEASRDGKPFDLETLGTALGDDELIFLRLRITDTQQ